MKKRASKDSKNNERANEDIKPTATPSTFVIGILTERQNNLPQHLDPPQPPIDDNGSVQGADSDTEIFVPDGGWGWFVVLASFFMNVIGG